MRNDEFAIHHECCAGLRQDEQDDQDEDSGASSCSSCKSCPSLIHHSSPEAVLDRRDSPFAIHHSLPPLPPPLTVAASAPCSSPCTVARRASIPLRREGRPVPRRRGRSSLR